MKRDYPPIEQLRHDFGKHKIIPPAYETVILYALSYFPELRDRRIRFVVKNKGTYPLETVTSFGSLLIPGAKRSFTITILEEADHPVKMALLSNLPIEAQVGAIAHELSHVVRMCAGGTGALVEHKFARKTEGRRKHERATGVIAIEHGLGFELYVHAAYIRKIPGYVQHFKEIDTHYLKPQEILDTLPEGTVAP